MMGKVYYCISTLIIFNLACSYLWSSKASCSDLTNTTLKQTKEAKNNTLLLETIKTLY